MADDDQDLLGGDAGLADAAAQALGEEGQEHLDGTNYAQVKFVGMAWEAVTPPSLKEEVAFRIEGMCVGLGEEVMADGDVRQVAKVKVTKIERIEDATFGH